MSATVLGELTFELSRRSMAGADPLPFLREAAGAIARALDVAGAVLVVPATTWVGGSDEVSTLAGEVQLRDGQGPLATAMRTGRPIPTPDLTRIGPPALAALAADVGFGGAVSTALLTGGRVVAGVQVVGRTARSIEPWHFEAIDELADVLAARIADLVEIARLRHTSGSFAQSPRAVPVSPDAAGGGRTAVLPASTVGPTVLPPVVGETGCVPPDFVPVPLKDASPELVTQALRAVTSNVVPLPRREPPQTTPGPPGSRHRRT